MTRRNSLIFAYWKPEIGEVFLGDVDVQDSCEMPSVVNLYQCEQSSLLVEHN